MSQSLIQLGQGVGAVFFTSMSDRFGRKPVHTFSYISLLIVGLASAFLHNFLPFAVLRFMTGMLQQVISFLLFVK